MIIVLGRPLVTRPEPDSELVPAGIAADIAATVARSGADVQIVGSIGDDPEGDRVVVELGRLGIGHAALLRDPSTRTPVLGRTSGRLLPRLDAADVELGLRYVPGCRVLVLTDALDEAARAAALEAAAYHGAAVVMIAPPGTVDAEALGDSVTLLETPSSEEDQEAPGVDQADDLDVATPFAAFVADYAMRLDRGERPEQAFAEALGSGAWESSPDEVS